MNAINECIISEKTAQKSPIHMITTFTKEIDSRLP
jgi:hypothetical protein